MGRTKLAWLVLILAIIFYCYEFFLRIFPSTILGPLMLHFNVNTLDITELLASYYLSYSLGQVPAGLILDRYSAHRVLPFAVLVCVLGLLLFISTTNPRVAEIGRIVIGFGSAFSLVGVLKLTRDYLSPNYFSRVVGITISLGTLMATYAEVISLKLVAHNDWMRIFYGSILGGILLSAVLWFGVRKFTYLPTSKRRVSSWGESWKEIKVLLRYRALWLNAVMGGLFYAPTSVLAALYGTYFLSHRYYLSLSQSAFCISLLFLGWVIGSPLVGWLCDRMRHEIKVIQITAFLALVVSTFIVSMNFSKPFVIELLMFLLGLFSSGQILVWKIFSVITPVKTEGLGAALTNSLIMLIVGAIQLLVGYLLVKWPGESALSILPICFALSILLARVFSYRTAEHKLEP